MHDLIYLIGYRGVGKSTVGKKVAESIGYGFFDTDQEIVKNEKTTINRIVEKSGWQEFRRLEKEILLSTITMRKSVVATGGGAVLHQEMWQKLGLGSVVIWLTADNDTIVQRIAQDSHSKSQRPSLTNAGTVDEVIAVLNERAPLYKEIADEQFDTSTCNVETLVLNITAILTKKYNIDTVDTL